jgi:hypothetical protein
MAIVDMVTGKTPNHFSAGEVHLQNLDATEDDLIRPDQDLIKRREPDSVVWIDNDSFATANEGDYEDENGEEGGGRGFTVFNKDDGNPNILYAVSDSFLAHAYIYTMDVSTHPATIVSKITVKDGGSAATDLDLEGIAVGPDGHFWLASEGG